MKTQYSEQVNKKTIKNKFEKQKPKDTKEKTTTSKGGEKCSTCNVGLKSASDDYYIEGS